MLGPAAVAVPEDVLALAEMESLLIAPGNQQAAR